MSENNIIAAILAGGKSRRFGVDKSTAKLGSKTLLEHTIEIINDKFSEIIVVSNNNIKLNSKKIIKINDCIVGQLGPLVGVLSAMKWVKENKKKYSWIATFPCDTPYFKNTVVDEMIQCSKIKDSKLFFLKSKNKRHNIFGLWSIDLIDTLENDIKNNIRKVEKWADKIGIETIDIDDKEKFGDFLNINTKEDFTQAKNLFKK